MSAIQAAAFDAQLNWVQNQVEWMRSASSKTEDIHMMLSLAESIKLAKLRHSDDTDRENAARINARGRERDGRVVRPILEFTGPKEDADAFRDDDSYTIDIGPNRYTGCKVTRRIDLGEGFGAVQFDYGLKLIGANA